MRVFAEISCNMGILGSHKIPYCIMNISKDPTTVCLLDNSFINRYGGFILAPIAVASQMTCPMCIQPRCFLPTFWKNIGKFAWVPSALGMSSPVKAWKNYPCVINATRWKAFSVVIWLVWWQYSLMASYASNNTKAYRINTRITYWSLWKFITEVCSHMKSHPWKPCRLFLSKYHTVHKYMMTQKLNPFAYWSMHNWTLAINRRD